MGHKVHPVGFRLGVIRDWQSKWYSDASYADFVLEDVKLRDAVNSRYREAAISLIEIDRQAKDITLSLHTARPGIVIGRGGQRVDEMRLYLEGLVGKRVRLNILEIRQPELDAFLVARTIAEQIERRVAYRRAMKQAIFRTLQAGAKGIRISCAGRLGDAEIARRQTMHEGQVPLHTLRADIDYGFTEAHTTMGQIGIKVWIYKGQVLPERSPVEAEAAAVETAEKPAGIIEAAVAPPVTELAETAAPVEVAVSAEAEPAAKTEEKPAKPRARRVAKPAISAESEEKPAKPPVTRRRKKETATAKAQDEVSGSASGIKSKAGSAANKGKEEKDAAT